MYYADYMLNKKVRMQTQAFIEGLQLVIKREQLSIFLSDEVQLLITGGIEEEIDVDDMRRNTVYHGFTDSDPFIQEFWKILKSLSPEDKEKFLSFVTGSNRPPLLGFRYLQPQLCLHQVILDRGEMRFPTASTCMNMLKLPHYGGDFKKLRETLIYAINSGAGFNLE